MTHARCLYWSGPGRTLVGDGRSQSVGSDLRTLGKDAWFVVSAPARSSSSDLQTAGLIAAGAAGLLFLADDAVHEWMHSDPRVAGLLKPFRESSPVSIMGRTWFFLLPMSVSLYAAGHAFDSPNLRDAGMGCATANLTTTLTRTAVAHLIGRLRPGEHRGPFQFEVFAFGPWEQRSFPGGHASNIMSCASYFNHRFDMGLATVPIWLVAAGVGVGRIADDAHWTSDTFVGMAYGYGMGRNMAHRFAARRGAPPAEQSLQSGLSLGLKITF